MGVYNDGPRRFKTIELNNLATIFGRNRMKSDRRNFKINRRFRRRYERGITDKFIPAVERMRRTRSSVADKSKTLLILSTASFDNGEARNSTDTWSRRRTNFREMGMEHDWRKQIEFG